MEKATLIETLFAFLKLKFSSKPKKKKMIEMGLS